MKTLIALFTHNWGIKLIAAVIAIAVFLCVRGMKDPRDTTSKDKSSPTIQMKGNPNADAAN